PVAPRRDRAVRRRRRPILERVARPPPRSDGLHALDADRRPHLPLLVDGRAQLAARARLPRSGLVTDGDARARGRAADVARGPARRPQRRHGRADARRTLSATSRTVRRPPVVVAIARTRRGSLPRAGRRRRTVTARRSPAPSEKRVRPSRRPPRAMSANVP